MTADKPTPMQRLIALTAHVRHLQQQCSADDTATQIRIARWTVDLAWLWHRLSEAVNDIDECQTLENQFK
jgi:hypothetical protein